MAASATNVVLQRRVMVIVTHRHLDVDQSQASESRIMERLVVHARIGDDEIGTLLAVASNVPGDLAARRIAQINKAGRNIHFAGWAGIRQGDPHYYRVQTADFLIEFDDTQDNANHIHSVWRDFNGDFGEDLLKYHYQTSHQKEN